MHGTDLDGLFWFRLPELVNLDAEHRFEERLGDFLVAKHHGEHESVRDGELFKRCAFIFHFYVYGGNAPAKADRDGPYLYIKTGETGKCAKIGKKILFT